MKRPTVYFSSTIFLISVLSIWGVQVVGANPPTTSQFIFGVTGRPEEMARAQRCDACRGSGWMECYTCEGKGEYQDSKGKWRLCRKCSGTGKVRCERCYGKGYIESW